MRVLVVVLRPVMPLNTIGTIIIGSVIRVAQRVLIE